jgi:hypothetical protein
MGGVDVKRTAMIYTNVSFVGTTALAEELMPLGPRYASGVIVTQVVPVVDSYATTILKYKSALAKFSTASTRTTRAAIANRPSASLSTTRKNLKRSRSR